MLVSEGTARKLAPQANMWFISRPLIETWMIDNLGPQARVRDALRNGYDILERLPRIIENLEKGAAMVASGKLELAPETIRALRGGQHKNRIWTYVWITLAAGLLLVAHLT